MKRMLIKDLLSSKKPIASIKVQGWVRTRRDAKSFSFIEINDGSSLENIQTIIDANSADYHKVTEAGTGAAVSILGELVKSKGKGQSWELIADSLEIIGRSDATYPLQKKGHSPEYLRQIAHLRPRSNLFGSVFRVRSRLAFAIHQFFQRRDFIYIHSPIITTNDCEGAGELFKVSTTNVNQKIKNDQNDHKVQNDQKDQNHHNVQNDHSDQKDQNDQNSCQAFFGKSTYLTVSGQLSAEVFASAFSNVYTFGPTFRAENSHTSRHASEFWMVEPEMAFCDLKGAMNLAESILKYLIEDAAKHCQKEMNLFSRFVDKGLEKRLMMLCESPFQRISYAEAIEILQASDRHFEHPANYGSNLQSEHERFLTESYFKSPISVFDYPKSLKPFYMRLNDDGKTVAAMDVLLPEIGEIIGGSQREEREAQLLLQMKRHDLRREDYEWYVDLRRYGSVPHSGFGLGFDRMLMCVTGLKNIRDVIAFARTPGSAEF